MRTAHDLIRRCFWDAGLNTELVRVGYLDRLADQQVVEKPLGAFEWVDISTVGGPDVLAIPQHRIQYITYGDEGIVWEKATRVDRIFGSTGQPSIMPRLQLAAEAAAETAADVAIAPAAATVAPAAAALDGHAVAAAVAPPATGIGPAAHMDDRPNAFFCVSLHSPSVLRAVGDAQAAIVAADPRLGALVDGAASTTGAPASCSRFGFPSFRRGNSPVHL